jgi:hypothetical protein
MQAAQTSGRILRFAQLLPLKKSQKRQPDAWLAGQPQFVAGGAPEAICLPTPPALDLFV